MPTRANAIGRYAGLAPELQDTLRRNGMQARIVDTGDAVLLAVQGHDSPLLTYLPTPAQLKVLTDGGTNSSNRKAYDAFTEIIGKDFELPLDYVHARNTYGRVAMGLHGYRIGEGEYGRAATLDLWAHRGMLGWAPRHHRTERFREILAELGYATRAPVVLNRPDGRVKPGELLGGGFGFYYKGTALPDRSVGSGEDVLKELRDIVPAIQARPASGKKAVPYSEAVTSDVYFSPDKWNEVLSSHGIDVDAEAKTLTVRSTAINRDLVYDISDIELIGLTAGSLKEIPLESRIGLINEIIGDDFEGKVTRELLESREPLGFAVSQRALREIREEELGLQPEPIWPKSNSLIITQDLVLQGSLNPQKYGADVIGDDLYFMKPREAWFREGAHGREVSVGRIRVEPVRDPEQQAVSDMKYRMTAVIDGEEVSHEITRRQYDKFMAVDDYHRMKLFSKVFSEVDMKRLPRERGEVGTNLGAAILAALTVAGEMARGPRMAPDLYMERHAGGHVYMKPGVDSPQDIASRAFEAGLNAAGHGPGLGR